MKITVNQYAKLLHEAYQVSSEKERKVLVGGVVDLIKKNRDQNKLKDIENRYWSVQKKESKQLKGVVYTARKIDKNQLNKIKKAVATQKDVPSKLIELKNEINSNLKGGFIVEIENEVLDGSLDSKIFRVKQALAG